MSLPGCCFSAATAAETSPSSRCELLHSTSSRVVEATYLGVVFMYSAMSLSASGQNLAHSW